MTTPPAPGAAGPPRPFEGGWQGHHDRHCIWVVAPAGYPHSHAFDEVALTLSEAFCELGGSAPVVAGPADFAGRAPIVYGANLLAPGSAAHLPPDSVLVNLEQAERDTRWITPDYLATLAALPVLDYSPRNRDALAALGVPHARVLAIGYAPALTRIVPARHQDIDVLFYGSLNHRREVVLRRMQRAGLRVEHLFGVYGAARDAGIARAKVVVNLHAYDAKVFEVVRVSYLLANAVCVLTEGEATDPDLAPFAAGLAVAPYDGLVERAVTLVADADERARLGAAGLAAMRARSQVDALRAVLAG
ncbi:MAG TPA: hypothetical protein VGC67_03735 [Cellulomonas sp.]